MKTYRLNFLVLACFIINNAISQELELTSKDSIVANSWIVGLGYNIVDDSGDVFDNLFSVEDQWNAVPYPSRISIGRYFKNGIGIEAIGTYNTYKEGKIIDGTVNAEETNYFGLDTRLSYDLNKIIGETAWFDPYIGVGLGYTDANNQGRGTYNAVIGSRFWFSDKFGLDFSSSGKWSIGDNATNHIQHAAGVVYRFGIEKELSKKGLKKLAVINALEKENQSVKDSISRANRAAEEAKVLADKLAKEKEDALLAEENARKKAKEDYQRNIENAVKELGYVYFDLNSSYLSREYKGLLDKLAMIMQDNPTLKIQIGSHTDARGSDRYNIWLSNRRVKRTLDYLVAKGIDTNRLEGKGFGENQLTNECDGHTYCKEEQHRENRRSEFVVIF